MNKPLILLTVLVLAGCSSTPKPADYPVSPMMATAYAEGAMTITWKAESNQTYTVYYTDVPYGTKPDWKTLPQATNLRGAGKQVTISDKVAPDSLRRYLLLRGDQKPY
ncbi:MAG: hypothetical protein HOO88_00230 [Kiritimatiellaceae bacterium]|nr:hypothetical protein [Kiritimatiellaceae bacterium]